MELECLADLESFVDLDASEPSYSSSEVPHSAIERSEVQGRKISFSLE